MVDREILNAVIIGYRQMLFDRYQYRQLKNQYDLPNSFDQARVNQFRDYFLGFVYPDLDKRAELDDAFASLDNYIKHPEKLLRIVLDSAGLVFKYGRHLRKILQAGLKALRCFRSANKFELALAKQAILENLQAPFGLADFDVMFEALDKAELEQFIKNNEELYAVLYDRKLVSKIKTIVEALIVKMKRRPKIYSAEEIRGLEIGRDIIVEGDKLFASLEKDDQEEILKLAIQIEKDALGVVFNSDL